MLMSIYEDPDTAADFALCDLEDQVRALDAIPAEVLAHYRDRFEDVADQLHQLAVKAPREVTTCESQAHPNSGGAGGKAPSLAKLHPSTKWTLKPGSTPSESSDTASGPRDQCSPPASGGNPKSILKPAS